ncbi:MAG TPA: glycosyltransferase family 2 protein [Acidobacteriaceae bacterium]|nr:glycosyltransferase family 2 protein [Acidobacteriaceae bacterium]
MEAVAMGWRSLAFAWQSKAALSSAPSVLAISIVSAVILCAAIPALLFFFSNLWLFARPGPLWNKRSLPKLSVLIPARNESASIMDAVTSVLTSRGVSLELIVLDDGSTDDTADKVRLLAELDPRVRLETAPPLPDEWNGKQHACWVLASLAENDYLCFLDADVRLGEEALYRMLGELNQDEQLALASGFPCQQTKSFLEWLLLPLIHFVLLGFLPLVGEQRSASAAFAAGCGQFVMVRRDAYFASGGHQAIHSTMHDGLLLPRLFRHHGFRTRLYDLSRDAVCRMYQNAGEVWSGLRKNATEGMASPRRLPLFTLLLFCGQVLPLPLLLWVLAAKETVLAAIALAALFLGYAIRIVSAIHYRQSWRGVALHPLGVLVLLAVQWSALVRKLQRRPAVWKQRVYEAG